MKRERRTEEDWRRKRRTKEGKMEEEVERWSGSTSRRSDGGE